MDEGVDEENIVNVRQDYYHWPYEEDVVSVVRRVAVV